MDQLRTEEEKDKVDRRLLKRQEERKRKLKEAGFDYDFDMVAYVCFLFPVFSARRDIYIPVQKKKPRTSSS